MTADHRGEPIEVSPADEEFVAHLLHSEPTPAMPTEVFDRLQAVIDDEVRRRDETVDPAAWAKEAKKKAMARFGNTVHHADAGYGSKQVRPDRVDHRN